MQSSMISPDNLDNSADGCPMLLPMFLGKRLTALDGRMRTGTAERVRS